MAKKKRAKMPLQQCPECGRIQSLKHSTCRKCGLDLEQAKVTYWVDYRLPNGKQRRVSLAAYSDLDPHSFDDALDLISKLRLCKRQKQAFDIPEQTITFNQLKKWYLKLASVQELASYKTGSLQSFLKGWCDEYGESVVGDITKVDVKDFRIKKSKTHKPRTIDGYIAGVKTMLKMAVDAGKLSMDALKPFQIKGLLKRRSNARDRILSAEEFDALVSDNHCQWLTWALQIAYHTGMRQREVLGLIWSMVDLESNLIHVPAWLTKDDEDRDVPVLPSLKPILISIPRALRCDYVINDGERPLWGALLRRRLEEACFRVGIPYGRNTDNGFIFHDCRHTFNTNMDQAGIPKAAIMAWTGHSSEEMFYRYRTVNKQDQLKAEEKYEDYLKSLVDQMLSEKEKAQRV